MDRNVCIVGGGSLGHVIAGWLANKGINVSVLTRKPEVWSDRLKINTPEGTFISGISKVSSNPVDVIPKADVVLLTVPGYANRSELESIRPYLSRGTYVGGVFCSSGFFFEALNVLPENIKLWGFQRVPFISRTVSYGREANLMGFRPELNIAVERDTEESKEEFRKWVEDSFGCKTNLMKNFYEVSITNSNPILHTARLYTMFHDWNRGKRIGRNILFYEEWTTESFRISLF